MVYYKRDIEVKIKKLAKSYPVIVLCGPRQSGKSTLAKKVFKDYTYTTLEDLDEREFATQDPRAFLNQFKGKVIIDEVQNVPTLFSYIQGIVDEKKIKGHFILTGSLQLSLMQGVTQSLAGRASIFELLPLCFSEYERSRFTPKSIEEILFRGAYPSICFGKMPIKDWYRDYCTNYLEKDVRKMLQIKDLGTFQLFLKMCAARCGQIINYTSFANDCGISPNTAKEWMNILEASYIIYRLQPYYRNFSKRLIKSPKLYFYDTGIACSLLSIKTSHELITHPSRGGLFESWVISEIKKAFYNNHSSAPVFYLRDNKGAEIDLVIDKGTQFDLLEIKSVKTINSSYFENLNYFAQLEPENVFSKLLVYAGDKLQTRSESIVVPWNKLSTLALDF